AFEAGDARKMAHWDVLFHRTIMEATGNQILIETWGSLMIEARTYVTLSNLMGRLPDLDLAHWHDPIIEALREGDPDHCAMEMRKHVEAFGKVMNDIFHQKAIEDDRSTALDSSEKLTMSAARTG
ncbi:MAG: FCD domain-containing protein, partial [Pseudomonadota bacterium]